ncbi:LysR family transcriptional regulator [Agrobacterium vitis]|uniref:LysR family transcriptional regulator n=1 Tax=Agrobacterium vitis TaxID=373 RepID=UPI0012E8B477|nr:LysR family transcriptional regulator [Agrobacterium vitis]
MQNNFTIEITVTLEQLTIFLAVAERQHVTRAAEAIGLTPSAVSAAIRALEINHDVLLFDRVGRGIELTQAGRIFIDEARATVDAANHAALVLAELGGLSRGKLTIHASQTVASHWLPRKMMQFHALHPDIELALTIGNSASVADAVETGRAELGFVEAEIPSQTLTHLVVAEDEMVIVVPCGHPLADPAVDMPAAILATPWILREHGSGTRAYFEQALKAMEIEPSSLTVALTFPSNEAVLSALGAGGCASALSRSAVQALVASGALQIAPIPLPARHFTALRHRERRISGAARAFLQGATDCN